MMEGRSRGIGRNRRGWMKKKGGKTTATKQRGRKGAALGMGENNKGGRKEDGEERRER